MAKKSSKGASAQKGKVVRLNLSIGEEEYQLLFFRALTSGCTAGELVTKLIAARVKEWGFPANLANRIGIHDRLVPSGLVNETGPSHASQDAG